MLQRASHHLQGANLLIQGDVPMGSGLSSSAAIEVASGLALLENSGIHVDRLELVKLCRRAENEFVGARVGIMDQFVSSCGQAGHALMLDCRSLEYSFLPLPRDVSLVICNTMVKHALASGEYNTRREECACCHGQCPAFALCEMSVLQNSRLTPALFQSSSISGVVT